MTATDAPLPPKPARTRRTWRSFRTISALVLREMSSTYGRSPGGYIWAVLEPLGMIAILALAFSILLRSPSLGNSFVLFYATGYMPFKMYGDLSRKTANALRFSGALLAYPAVTFVDALLSRLILNGLTQLMVSYIIMSGVFLTQDTRAILDFPPMLEAMAMAAALGFGIGTLNCLLFDMFPIWKSTWGILTRPLMLASAIIYIYEDLPQFAQNILWFNPLVHITGIMRTGFFPFYDATYASPVYVWSVALVCASLGLLFLRRFYRQLRTL